MVESLQCISGLFVGEPQLSVSPVGRCRFAARVEVQVGSRGRHAATRARPVATLVVVGPAAERAYAQFTSGDRFLAEGAWVLLDPAAGEERGGGVEFVAQHLGHDLAQHRYAVDRTRRRGWQPHAPAHLLATDWAAPLLEPVLKCGPVAS